MQLRVDWPACRASGVCAQLLPELITLDEWGYPRLQGSRVPDRFTEPSERAVAACPTLALRLVEAPEPPGSRRERRRLAS